MEEQIPLVDKCYIVEKFRGKGGWYFVRIPEIEQSKHTPFGWVRVWGAVDGYEIKNYNLQSMGNGNLFLPLKSEIRKKIKKEIGDLVYVTLYQDNNPTDIPEELKLCLLNEPNAYETFLSYTEGEKKTIINRIYSAKTDNTKIDRIVKTIEQINQNNK